MAYNGVVKKELAGNCTVSTYALKIYMVINPGVIVTILSVSQVLKIKDIICIIE